MARSRFRVPRRGDLSRELDQLSQKTHTPAMKARKEDAPMAKSRTGMLAVLAIVLIGIVVASTATGREDVDQNQHSDDHAEGVSTHVGSVESTTSTRIVNTRYGFSFETCGLEIGIEGIAGTADPATNFSYRLRFIAPNTGFTYSSVSITVHDPEAIHTKEASTWHSPLSKQISYYRDRAAATGSSDLTPTTLRLGQHTIDGFTYKRGISRHTEAFAQIGSYVVAISMHGDDNHEAEWLQLSCITDSFAIEGDLGGSSVQ
jgi:hypothetical protein